MIHTKPSSPHRPRSVPAAVFALATAAAFSSGIACSEPEGAQEAEVDSGPIDTSEPRTPWFAALHVTEINYDLAEADRAFAAAAELGFSGVRTDVFWWDIEPVRGQWDAAKLAFYSDYVDHARLAGLDVLIIMSNPPKWATDLYDQDADLFWPAYEAYVTEVVDLVGDRVDRYQLWNEANHLVDPIDEEDDWQLFTRAAAIVRANDPGADTLVNVMANIDGWEDSVTGWIQQAGDAFDVIGIDHYPGTWATGSKNDWTPLGVLVQRINDPEDSWYGKRGAVLETGFSSWSDILADEADQRDWVLTSLPEVRELVEASRSMEREIELVGFYQLIDTNTNDLPGGIFEIGKEAHFGLFQDDLAPKPASAALADEIARY